MDEWQIRVYMLNLREPWDRGGWWCKISGRKHWDGA